MRLFFSSISVRVTNSVSVRQRWSMRFEGAEGLFVEFDPECDDRPAIDDVRRSDPMHVNAEVGAMRSTPT